MENILNDLFDLLDTGKRTPEYIQACQQAKPEYHRLEKLAQDNRELDAIWGAAVRVGAADEPVWFARGFRLGVRLMLAALDGEPMVRE